MENSKDFRIKSLGKCKIQSPLIGIRFATQDDHVLLYTDLYKNMEYISKGGEPPRFEMAGPRKKIYFDPAKISCGIVTCGGLCPGLNDVIRSIALSLTHHYNVETIYGFQYGYEGLNPEYGHEPIKLTHKKVTRIDNMGGTILGSSRGNQDPKVMVDYLVDLNVHILFCIGGDGTQRGALAISNEIEKRGLDISVIGIPKTIDNDISYVQKTFGFETAVKEAVTATHAAYIEASGARKGIGLVKLMGRDSGFISAYAALADNHINFCLVPESPFKLKKLFAALKDRLDKAGYAVIVVSEGAGQDLIEGERQIDASGNVKHIDIGLFLRDKIKDHFKEEGEKINLKYIDPSYIIRSQRANPHDSAFCLLMGHNAVHAGMAGKTEMLVGFWNHQFTHVPIELAISERKKIDAESWLWNSVLASTGQPTDMEK